VLFFATFTVSIGVKSGPDVLSIAMSTKAEGLDHPCFAFSMTIVRVSAN